EAPALAEKRADVPGPVGAAIMTGLARDPAKRPSAEQFAKLLAGERDDRAVPPRLASPKLKLLAGALAAVGLAMLVFALSHHGDDTDTAAHPTPIENAAGQPQQQHFDDNG